MWNFLVTSDLNSDLSLAKVPIQLISLHMELDTCGRCHEFVLAIGCNVNCLSLPTMKFPLRGIRSESVGDIHVGYGGHTAKVFGCYQHAYQSSDVCFGANLSFYLPSTAHSVLNKMWILMWCWVNYQTSPGSLTKTLQSL